MKKSLFLLLIFAGLTLSNANDCLPLEEELVTYQEYKMASPEVRHEYKELVEMMELERFHFTNCMLERLESGEAGPQETLNEIIKKTAGRMTFDIMDELDNDGNGLNKEFNE